MAMSNTTNTQPTDHDWLLHRPRIYHLYYVLRHSLEETQQILQQETGFYASLRMYKDRVKDMVRYPKRISMQKYQAMSCISDEYQRQGITVSFAIPSGLYFVRRTSAQVKKQLRRPHRLPPVKMIEAGETLTASGIVIHEVATTESSLLTSNTSQDARSGDVTSPAPTPEDSRRDGFPLTFGRETMIQTGTHIALSQICDRHQSWASHQSGHSNSSIIHDHRQEALIKTSLMTSQSVAHKSPSSRLSLSGMRIFRNRVRLYT